MSGWESVESYEPHTFQEVLICLPFDSYHNPGLEAGNKVVLPPSCLSRITDMGIRFPWFFKMESFKSDKTTHCGVLEFCADEGFVFVPRFMMNSLGIGERDEVILRQARPTMGTRMKLQPHETAFLDVADVRAVLERALKGFSCLSKGDTVGVRYGEREFLVDVVEVGPGEEVISLIDTDCEVEFATPLDYVEVKEAEGVTAGFRAFMGKGRRLGGKAVVKEERVEIDGGGKGGAVRPFSVVAKRVDGERCAVAREEAGKKRKKDGGKDEKEFKPFSGRGRILGD